MNNDATLQPILWWPNVGEKPEVEEPERRKVSLLELNGYIWINISIFSKETRNLRQSFHI